MTYYRTYKAYGSIVEEVDKETVVKALQPHFTTVEYAMWHLHNSGRIDTCTAVYECYEEDNE